MISRRTAVGGLAATAVLPFAARAQADYPGNRTIRLVVGYPAGGANDVIGRIIADRLQALWRTTVLVENIAGSANIGMDRIAKGPTDGTQILVVPPQIAINQYLYAKLAYDPEKDLIPIAQVARLPNILVVRKGLEVNSVQDFIAYAKANPGKLNYASSGNGTTIHLSAELFKRMTGVDMNHVPYRGSAPAVNDLVAGQVDLMFDNATSIIGQVRGGTVRALGITSLQRSAAARSADGRRDRPRLRYRVVVRHRRAHRNLGGHHRQDRAVGPHRDTGGCGQGADGRRHRRSGCLGS
jgi:tripartite-type tricarboxylate transporter receptor subunit TctC